MSKKKILASFVAPQQFSKTYTSKGRRVAEAGVLWQGQPVGTLIVSTKAN